MNWFDCLVTFKKVSEHQSFIGAAHDMGTKNSVITKRIQWLEKQLSCTLLLRTTRKVTVTDAGEHLLKQINPLLDEWRDIHLQLLDYQNQPHGEITVCSAPNINSLPGFSALSDRFLQEYPHLRLHLTSTHEPINLIAIKLNCSDGQISLYTADMVFT